MFQNVEHVIVIDNNEKMMTVSQVVSGSGGVNGSAAAFVGADGVTVKFPWPNGTWALKPNPDGKTARVSLTSTFGPFSMDNSATFHREHSNWDTNPLRGGRDVIYNFGEHQERDSIRR